MTIKVARPLPECRRCARPMRRQRWAETGGVCSRCRTAPEAMAAAQRAARLAAVAEDAERRTQERIDQLAAKRAARAGAGYR